MLRVVLALALLPLSSPADAWRDALAFAEGLYEAQPDSVHTRVGYAEALFRAGRVREAQALLEEDVAALDEAPRGLVVLARLRAARGRGREARELFERAHELAPDDPWVAYRTAGAAPTRAEIIERLRRFIELAGDDHADWVEAARGKIDLFGKLGERRLWVATSSPERMELTVTPWANVGGPVRGYLVDVDLGAKRKTPMLFDTGSGGLFMLQRIAKKRGFEPIAEETAFGGGGDKRHRSPRGLLPVVRVGELAFKDALVTTTPREIEATGRFHGILGPSVFDGYRIDADLEDGRIAFDRGAAAAAGEPYWVISGQWLVEAEANGVKGLFLLDTGATTSAVSLELAERLEGVRLLDNADVRGFGGRYRGSYRVRGARLVFHGVEAPQGINAVDLSLKSEVAGVELSGLIGLDVLAGGRLTLDTRSHTVRFRPAEERKR